MACKSRIVRARAGLGGVAAAKHLAGCCISVTLGLMAGPALAEGLLTPLGPVAADERAHLIRVTAITMIVVVPVLIGVPLLLWRYRRGRKGIYRPQFEFSAPLEILMWGVPSLIVIVLGYWLWYSTVKLDPYRPLGTAPLEVQAVGLDWKWLFVYPNEGVASVGTLAVPVSRPVEMRLTTDTVMQSFMVPALAGQVYAMPGMVTKLNFQADRPGTVMGENTQFNGVGFAGQKVVVEALSPTDWQAWMDAAHRGPTLDAQRYSELARRGTLSDARKALGISDGPVRLRLADRGLFNQILQRYRGGEALSGARQPGAPGYLPKEVQP